MSRYILVFIFISFIGWVWESIYCTLLDKKWANRGFLYGPICPIYGAATMLALILFDLSKAGVIPALNWWQLILGGFVASAVIEYPTSVILEKLFNARWWDYFDMPLNINGRVSFFSSLGFGLAALLEWNVILPFSDHVIAAMPLLLADGLAYFFIAIMAADTTLTVSALTDFQKKVAVVDSSFQNHMTGAVEHAYATCSALHRKAVARIKVFKMSDRQKHIADSLREEHFSELMDLYRSSDVVQQMKEYMQHGDTTTYEHCENVAWISYLVNERLHLNADERKLIEAAMLHDLYLYDWHDGKPERRTHGFDHPDIAADNAAEYFDISKENQDIIRSHMWPLNIRRVPKSKEAAILCIVDKYCAVAETLRLSKRLSPKKLKDK